MVQNRNVGIKAIDVYIPNKFVNQNELEVHDGVSPGKYTIGLGQEKMAYCDDTEDIYSLVLTATRSLFNKYDIDPKNIGRLEVGTETIIDKSKSVKSVLMQLFEESGNFDVEGVDNLNACYGGTNAVFNAIHWVESSFWDGRDALVVAADIALYAEGNARPTGGAGAVAMLIGPNAPILFEQGKRGSYMAHAYDFYKPNLSSEYPVVDGKFSVSCYLKALDMSYKIYKKKVIMNESKQGYAEFSSKLDMTSFDYCCFHAPTRKQTIKAYARMFYVDFLKNPDEKKYDNFRNQLEVISYETSLTDKTFEKLLINATKNLYAERVYPSTLLSANVGNTYTASLYFCLVSLLCSAPAKELLGKRIGMFSYGSGLASSFFSLKIVDDVSDITDKIQLMKKLNQRKETSPSEFEKSLQLRHDCYGKSNFKPKGSIKDFPKGTYYLTAVDEKFRRSYQII